MIQSQKLQSQWDFRKQDDVDSSNDIPESASSAEPAFTKLKQISDLMSNKSKHESRKSFQSAKINRDKNGNKMKITEHQLEGECSYDRVKRRSSHGYDSKNKRARYGTASLNSNLLYMQSILEELRVARENMFEWMRGEVRKLMDDAIPEQIAEEGCSKWKRIKFKHQGSMEPILNVGMPFPSTEPPRVSVKMTSKGVIPAMNLSHTEHPSASSPYLTLPTVLHKKGLGS